MAVLGVGPTMRPEVLPPDAPDGGGQDRPRSGQGWLTLGPGWGRLREAQGGRPACAPWVSSRRQVVGYVECDFVQIQVCNNACDEPQAVPRGVISHRK